jgi:hypothetical protein
MAHPPRVTDPSNSIEVGSGTAVALNWKLSKRLLPLFEVAPVRVNRKYALLALSKAVMVLRVWAAKLAGIALKTWTSVQFVASVL